MIISQIIGGLGNQMFQYAAGRALALERKDAYLLDTRGFVGYGLHHGFELQRVFEIDIRIASLQDVRNLLGWRSPALVRRIFARPQFRHLRGDSFVIEPYFHYWSGFKTVPKDVYLQGYWQSEQYFIREAEQIRKDFHFRRPLSVQNEQFVEQITNCPTAVSLHVRRGDYVSSAAALSTHGLCSIEYYQAAMAHILERFEGVEFFVFSDDIPWVRQHIQFSAPCHFIDHNKGIESYNDMRLMSLCRHNIIANSSFSWWGAWLNCHADKIVIAPARWFASDKFNSTDLLPADWVQL